MFSSLKRENYMFWEEVKAAVLAGEPVGCWTGLLGAAEGGHPFPSCINTRFFKAIKVTSDLKYPKDIPEAFLKSLFYDFWGGFAAII